MAGIPIESLNLSVRAIHVLQHMNIHNVEQLLSTPIEHIAGQRNVGVKTITEIENVVNQIDRYNLEANNIGEFFLNSIGENMSEITYSDEQIKEMSYHLTAELELSNRAMNALMKIECTTMDKLVRMSREDIKSIKGLGDKSSDEILFERDRWLRDNDFVIDDKDDISEDEKEFYQIVSKKIEPIAHIYWKKIRSVVMHNNEQGYPGFADGYEVCIRKIFSFEEMNKYIINFFLKCAPNGIIGISELRREIELLGLEFDIVILMDKISDGTICFEKDGYYLLKRPYAMDYFCDKYAENNERNGKIMLKRLSGVNLQMIGDMYGLTRERVRQILVQMTQKLPLMYEDYFREPYEYFKFTKEEFCKAFPSCGEIGYEYLFIKYKKGDIELTEEALCGYGGCFSERLKLFCKEETIRRDKVKVSKTEMIYRVLLSNSDKSMSIEEFEDKYYDYIERRNYPRERLSINMRTVINHLRNAKYIVFDRNNYVRYCEADSEIIWKMIDFSQYKNMVISTELIYKDYVELMDELDIRDGYELFYVIKSSIEKWNNSLFEINCRRVPVIVMGDGDEERQALQLLKEISPIEFQDYYEAYEGRFGIRKETAQGNPVISKTLSNYYADGMFAIDVPSIDEKDIFDFQRILSTKNFWFIDELEREFTRICVNSSVDAFNSAAFKRLGYSLNMGYAYNDVYGSVVNYFDEKIFSTDIVDLNELDRRLVNLSIFNSTLYRKKIDLEYIEVAPKILMSISKLEQVYGITVGDVKNLQKWVLNCSDKYYNAHSIWNKISELDCSEKLKNNDWMCTCIFRQQEELASLQVAGGIILCRDNSQLNFGLICQWLVEKYGRMTVQDLAAIFNETFATKVPVTKIAEKMRTYGLWENFVTNSFDEYIENLVISTETEINEEELFQEEFF